MHDKNKLFYVARWEFLRFFKWKDFVLSFTLILAIFLGFQLFEQIMESSGGEDLHIAVQSSEHLPFETEAGAETETVGRFVFHPSDANRESLRERLEDKEFDGVLFLSSSDEMELMVRSEANWQQELHEMISAARKDQRLAASGMSQEDLDRLLMPVALELSFADEFRQGGSGQLAAYGLITLMLIGLFVGSSYLFVGITGEKNQRVTEQIVSALSPQTWIDGKIVGLSFLVVVSLLVYAAAFVCSSLIGAVIWPAPGGADLPAVFVNPLLLLQVLVLAILGFAFWFTLFALIASTINDPNTSARSTFILLPVLPMGMAFAGVGQPNVLWMKVLGLLPFSAPTVLPVRMIMGEVGWWEFPLSIALLVGSVWLFRRAAAKVFRVSMLLYGKEPSWGEVIRWAREPV